MSATGQPAEGSTGTETAAAAETTAAPDYAALNDRTAQIASGLEGLTSEFQQFVQSQQPAPEPEPDPWESLFGPTEPQQPVDQFGNPIQAAPATPQFDPQAFQAAVQQTAQQLIERQYGPLAESVAQLQLQAQEAQLGQLVPQLANTPENQATRQETAARAQQFLEGAPQPVVQWAISNPRFVEMVFKAAEAERLAQSQEPAGGPQVLEGGGAHPGGAGDDWSLSKIMPNRVELPGGFR